MKLLHTSDWHVGRTIRGRSRLDEHRDVLAEIVTVAHDHQVDVVLIAGDLFDTAAPAPGAEEVVYRTLLDLVHGGAQVVLIAGNHDNPRRWSAVRPLLQRADVHLAADVRRPDDGGVVDVAVRSGERLRVALLPFLSKRGIVRADDLMRSSDADQQLKYADRVQGIITALTAGFVPDAVNVLLAHLTTLGATMGGGERQVHSILDYLVPSTAFPATAHYVALGHLHEAQQVAGPAPAWYCGSPLQLDFGEQAKAKHVLLVEATSTTPATIQRLRLTAGRELRTIAGTFERVLAEGAQHPDAHLRVVLQQPPSAGLANSVRESLPNAVDVQIADPNAPAPVGDWDDDHFHTSPEELFADFLAERGIEDPRLHHLFAELLGEVHAPDAA